MHSITRTLSVCSLGLLATACGNSDDPASQSIPAGPGSASSSAMDVPGPITRTPAATRAAAGTPERSIQDFVAALKAHRVSEAIELATTDEEWAEMEAAWEEQRKKEMRPDEVQEFEQFMGMLTADGAEEMLFAMAKPQLAEAQQQLQMVAAMAPMMAAGAMQESGAPEESMAILNGLVAKVVSLDVGNEAKCKQAIGIVCAAARALEMDSAEDLPALEFDELMGKADIAYGAIMDVLDVYGLGFDGIYDSMRVETLSMDGDMADLELSMDVFGVKVDGIPVSMERKAGKWFMQRPEQGVTEAPSSGGLAR